MDYNQALRYTSESEWKKLTVEQKQDVLQTIENKIAAEDGRAAGHVLFENMPNGYYGYYDLEDPDHLHLSYASIENAHDALNTLCHEGRHAYQRHCIVNNTGVPEPIREQFKTGFDEYVAPEKNYMAYCRNFNERDANSFAEQQCNLMEIERNALLEQDERNNAEPDMIENEASEQIQQSNNHDSNLKRLYLDNWMDETCSWQPEPEKVKTYGGSDTVKKVLTNKEVIEMMEKRCAEDEQLRAYNWDYLSKDQQVALNACWGNELESYKDAMKNVCRDERFGSSVQEFLSASDQVRECCPYEPAYVVNESDGLYNGETGERISANNGSRMNESPEIIDGESKNETHEQEMLPSREPSLRSQHNLNDESAHQTVQHDQLGEENEKTPEESSLAETHACEFDFGVQVPQQEEKQDETIGETLSIDR